MKRKMLTFGLILVLLFSLNLCASADNYKFGLALGWDVNDFAIAFRDEITKELKNTFPNCEITQTATNYDVAEQTNQIETMINSGVNALFVLPADPTSINSPLKKANEEGIPVFVGDSYPPNAYITTCAMSSNFAMGYENGMYICRRLNGEGKVVAINLPENSMWHARTLGLYFALENYPDVKLVGEYEHLPGATGGLTPKQGFKNLLIKTQGKIDAVWCSWDEASAEVTEVLMNEGREDVFVVGIDGFEQALDYVRRGTPLAAVMGQSPREMARVLVKAAKRKLNGKSVPHMINTPVYVFTEDGVPKAGLDCFGYDTLEYIKNNPEIMQRKL